MKRSQNILIATTGLLSVATLGSVAFAQSSSSSSSSGVPYYHRVPNQACIQALAAKDGTELSNFDAMTTAKRNALQTHQNALNASAGIADDSERLTAIQKANSDYRTALFSVMQSQASATQQAMTNVWNACGNSSGGEFGWHGMGMMNGFGFGGRGMGGWKHMRGF